MVTVTTSQVTSQTSTTPTASLATQNSNTWDDPSPASPSELNSWYCYDWANSVFSSAAAAMWLPVFMTNLATSFACPYEGVKWDYSEYTGGEVTEDLEYAWKGFRNTSTTCSYDYTLSPCAAYDADNSNNCRLYNEYGNSYTGLPHLPVHVRATMIGRDEDEQEKNGDFDLRKNADNKRHLAFDPAFDDYIVCDYDAGALTKIDVIRNVSFYAGGDERSLGYHDGGGSIKDDDGPVVVTLKILEGPTITASDISYESSNVDLLDPAVDLTLVPVTGSSTDFTLTFKPTKYFRIGSTTLTIKANDGEMRFTITSWRMPYCPYPVSFAGLTIRPVTFANAVISASVLFQVFFFLTFSGLGDFGPYRKQILVQTAVFGALSLMCNVFLTEPEHYALAGWLFIVTNLLFGASLVMYNAYLPYLTKSHPDFLAKMTEFRSDKRSMAKDKIVNLKLKDLLATYSELQDAISAKGFFYGYVSGCIMVLLTLGIILNDTSMNGLRTSLLATGIWWLLFSIPMIVNLRKRPGPPLPEGSIWFYTTFSFKRLSASMYCLKHIPQTRRFLIAYFLYSDAYSTIASVGILFATEELGMGFVDFSILALLSPLCAGVGIIFFRWLQLRNNYSSKTMIMITLSFITSLPAYGLLGFSGVIGIVHIWEMFMLITVYGFMLGAIQSYTRTAYADLIPPGQESEFFGLYEISDKGSSWMGPLVCGILFEVTGSMRWGFVYLLAVCLIGMYLVNETDFREGSEACRRKEIQVRMEAMRRKFGVSKLEAQLQAKTLLGVSSVAMSKVSKFKSGADASVAGDGVSEVITDGEVVEVVEGVEVPKEEMTVDDLLQRGGMSGHDRVRGSKVAPEEAFE